MTAHRLISIISLLRSYSPMSDAQDLVHELVYKYSYDMPQLVKSAYKPASLEFLIRFWQDPVGNFS